MQFSKFNLAVFALSLFTTSAFAEFSDSECLNSSFETNVSHKAFPLGLTSTTLKVTKNNCVIQLDLNKLQVVNKRWLLDICRGPIHIKYGTGAIDVFKRVEDCRSITTPSDYCRHLTELEVMLQDDGLIFAEGDKDNLKDDHGKMYCTYMLALAYLEKGMVFNKNQHYNEVLTRGIYKAELVKPEGRPLLSLPKARKTVDTKTTTPPPTAEDATTQEIPIEEPASGEF